MKQRFFFIVINPEAGRGKFVWKLDRIKTAFEERGFRYEIFYTHVNKKADAIISGNIELEEYTDILIMGGDGTLNEVVNGLGNKRIPISIISTGTGNDSIRPLYKNRGFVNQLHIALDGKVKEFDAGICNGRLFVNGVGIGFDGKVVELMQKKDKKHSGYISYLQTVLKILATYQEKPISFQIDNQEYTESILLFTIANGTTFGGGFKITPHARMNDGLLEICVMGRISPWKRFLNLPKMKSGHHSKLKAVKFLKGKEVVIDPSSDVVAHIDGEYFSNPPFNIKILPNHLLFRLPH